MENKKLYRSSTDKMVAGICGGLGEYLGVDPIVVRLVMVGLTLGGGSGVLLYIILAIIIPKEPTGTTEEEMTETPKIKTKEDPSFDEATEGKGKNVLAVLVILAGIILLTNRIIPFNWFRWDLFWPVGLIMLGVYLIFRR